MSTDPQPNKVIVRYPPSPTGKLHVGNLRTLIFNYLYAKKHGGSAVLRIEDTNQQRHDKEAEQYIVDTLNWLGLEYSEFHRQSDRTEIYTEQLQRLLADGKAYLSQEQHTQEELEEAAREGKVLRDSVIRFKNPGKTVTFHDEVLGNITVDTTDLGDFVIARSLTEPLYHFAVVTDDWLMGVTHIIRGDDHVSNTPRQILLQEALGAPRPVYVHVPLVVGSDGKKFGKRHGATGALEYRDKGYLADAFLNFMAFIGWNPGTDQEIFRRDELIDAFHFEGIQKKSAVFNQEKLDWFNKEHIRLLDPREIQRALLPYVESLEGFDKEIFESIIGQIVERIHKWSDLDDMISEGDIQYYFVPPVYDGDGLIWKKSDASTTKRHLEKLHQLLSDYNGPWDDSESIKSVVWDYAEANGRGDVLWPLRFALSGRERSPDPLTLLSLLGKEKSLTRIQTALDKLS